MKNKQNLDNKNKKETPHVIEWIDKLSDKIWDRVVNCLTWMRPSGRLHLWHYKWALENWLELQNNPNIKNNFLIADYQVLGDHLWETEKLRSSVVDMVIDWLAVGLDPDKSNFIVQSYIPEFAELFNYLTMFAPYTMAVNNPTLKDEMKKIKKRAEWENNGISLWFVNYPVSQVADIMLPRWEIVPVWEDQIPHIELARKLIKKVNKMYDTNYPLPLALISETPRLVWIDGNDKMSKSLWNTISISASYKEIKTQVNKMYTDPNKISIDSIWSIENHVVFQYLDIFYKDKQHLSELKERYIKWWENSIWDGEVKKLLIDVLEELIFPIREKRKYYEKNIHLVIEAIEKWSSRVRTEAIVMLKELREAMGLLDYWKEFIK